MEYVTTYALNRTAPFPRSPNGLLVYGVITTLSWEDHIGRIGQEDLVVYIEVGTDETKRLQEVLEPCEGVIAVKTFKPYQGGRVDIEFIRDGECIATVSKNYEHSPVYWIGE